MRLEKSSSDPTCGARAAAGVGGGVVVHSNLLDG